MSEKIRIEVTSDDIKNGVRGSKCDCPIALAVKRAFPDVVGVMVTKKAITLHGGGARSTSMVGSLPGEATIFIGDFDSVTGARPGPISFEVTFLTYDEWIR